MSRLTDGLRLLDEEAIALAFLPVINFTYIVWQLPDPGLALYGVAGLAALVSAATYNSYTYIDFRSFEFSQYGEFETKEDGTPYKKRKGNIVGIPILAVCSLLTISWVALLGYSLYRLYLLDNGSIWPISLIAISILFVCIVSTGVIFSSYEVDGDEDDSPDIDRFVDEQAGVVIYIITPSRSVESVVEVIPIDETELNLEASVNVDSSRESISK
ncbi:hypothetical protein HZS55_14780 [Halosimplex rubrum]|uniref:Uncharacterized protein n=1 Tax=Halosimplex rubrum TaxID=869889 RepID=A0A7D5P1P3_9EURY|nr:hypothetical protein [Halosimplex rubrum]QLH78477.1 hypothetical protein HZS55_14780 [Halosimplex rubrum]